MSAPQSSSSLILSQPDLGPFPPHIWDIIAARVIGPKLRTRDGNRINVGYPGTELSLVSKGMASVVTPCLYQFLVIDNYKDYLDLVSQPSRLDKMVKSLDIRVSDEYPIAWSLIHKLFPNLEHFHCQDLTVCTMNSPFLPKLVQAGSGYIDWDGFSLYNVNTNLEAIMLEDPSGILAEIEQVNDNRAIYKENNQPDPFQDYEGQEAVSNKYRAMRSLYVHKFRVEDIKQTFAGVEKFFAMMDMEMGRLEFLDLNVAHDWLDSNWMNEQRLTTLIEVLTALDLPVLKQLQITMIAPDKEEWTTLWDAKIPFPDLMARLCTAFPTLCTIYLEVQMQEVSEGGRANGQRRSESLLLSRWGEVGVESGFGAKWGLTEERETLEEVYEVLPGGLVRRGKIVRWWEEGVAHY